MLTKEDFMPARADRVLFLVAPVASVFFALSGFATIPFGDVLQVGGREISLQAVELNAGVLYVFAMLSMGVYGVVLAGLGLGEQLRAPRRPAGGRAHDLGGGRDRRLDHWRPAWSTARSDLQEIRRGARGRTGAA